MNEPTYDGFLYHTGHCGECDFVGKPYVNIGMAKLQMKRHYKLTHGFVLPVGKA